jgi:hypothetical protein
MERLTPDAVAEARLALDHDHAETGSGQRGSETGAGDTATDDGDLGRNPLHLTRTLGE